MSICARWTGVETKAFRAALRLVKEEFAAYVGVSVDAVKKWERLRAEIALSPAYAKRMDEKLASADPAVVERFRAILNVPAAIEGPAAEVLGEPGAGFDDDDRIVVSGRSLTGERVLVAVPRRTFVLGIGTGAVGAATSGFAGSPAANALAAMFADSSIDHVGHFDKLRMSLIESDNLYGSVQTLPHVLSALDLLGRLKRGKAGDLRGILRMQAMFAETAAWQYQDQRDFMSAGYWASNALQLSHRVADDYFIGLSLVRLSQLACDEGDASGAEELAGAARRNAPQASLFRAAAMTFRAHAQALDGDAVGSDRGYDSAREIVAVAPGDSNWGMFLDHAYIDAYQAHTRAETGDYSGATTQFAEAMTHMQPGYPRDKGVYLARAAVAHMAAGEIEPAAAKGLRALGIGLGTGSARILHKIRQLSGMIDPASTQTGVAEFRDAVAVWEDESCPDRS
ncbi:helix-turn-helix domain-containing protein [Nocardia tengchongensis]|uniref:helix-turn-helix domain-containing protein n=2 Tax=Nocardia tengchongensis TaxID=2055889 RepID=UPI0036A7B106